MKKRLLALCLGAMSALPAFAADGGAYTVPEEVGNAITTLTDVSGKLAGSALPAVLKIATPWFAIGVVFFLIAIAWRFFRGRK